MGPHYISTPILLRTACASPLSFHVVVREEGNLGKRRDLGGIEHRRSPFTNDLRVAYLVRTAVHAPGDGVERPREWF